jgi:hypothetical protein
MTTEDIHYNFNSEMRSLHEQAMDVVAKSRNQSSVVRALLERGVVLLQECAETTQEEVQVLFVLGGLELCGREADFLFGEQAKRDKITALIRDIDDYSLSKWGSKVSGS